MSCADCLTADNLVQNEVWNQRRPNNQGRALQGIRYDKYNEITYKLIFNHHKHLDGEIQELPDVRVNITAHIGKYFWFIPSVSQFPLFCLTLGVPLIPLYSN